MRQASRPSFGSGEAAGRSVSKGRRHSTTLPRRKHEPGQDRICKTEAGGCANRTFRGTFADKVKEVDVVGAVDPTTDRYFSVAAGVDDASAAAAAATVEDPANRDVV